MGSYSVKNPTDTFKSQRRPSGCVTIHYPRTLVGISLNELAVRHVQQADSLP